ncbi:MAG: PLP-dependent aminotransferase family protein, partial [Clostridia bacterium]|nr:PLP-dependent aminotransferase family protein [Clostridia bacterium]
DGTRYFADFVTNRANSKHFPFTIWARIMRDVISTWSEELLVSAPVGGVLKLREAISEHLRQFRGINVEASQIIVGAGTEYLYSLIIQLLGYGKVYALENPGYRKLYNVYRSHNTECIHIPMDGKGVLAKEIARRGADVVHISPSHHFPTGIIMPADRRYEILSWASEKEGRYIIEDDYDSEFRFSGKPVPALFGMDVNDRVIYMNTFTKSLASTIRISYMVLPRTLLNQFNSKLGFYSCTVSNFEQYTLAEFIKRGYFEKHINRMRNYYRKERDILIECIKKSSLANISVIKEENSGLHFLLQTKSSVSDEELIKKAAQSGIRISCLSQYYSDADEAPAHTVIINYSGISHEKIPEAIERLSKSISVQ